MVNVPSTSGWLITAKIFRELRVSDAEHKYLYILYISCLNNINNISLSPPMKCMSGWKVSQDMGDTF